MDYKKLAADIVTNLGGRDNINSLSHCATRLRFVLNDDSKADLTEISKLPSVLGATFGAGQAQIIMGAKVLDAFEAVHKDYGPFGSNSSQKHPETPKELTLKNGIMAVLNFVSGSVSTVITGLIAGGMIKLILYLATMIFSDLEQTGTFKMLTFVSDVPFYFMPMLVAYGAAKKLKMQPVYPLIVAAALLHPNWTTMVADGHAQTLLGIPVLLTSYSSTMVPALLSTVVVYWLEKFFNRFMPGILKTILVGALTVTVGAIITFTIAAPLGTYIGKYVIEFILWLQSTTGPLALGVLAGSLPLMVMFGMHTLFAPFMLQNFSSLGYDPLVKPALFLHVIAEGGMAIGVALRAKNKELRTNAWTIGITAIFAGISEPAVFGIGVKYRRPLFGAIAGGFAGGIVAGLFHVRHHMMSKTTIFALPVYKETIIGMAIAVAVTFLVSLIVTFILGFKEEESVAVKPTKVVTLDERDLIAPVTGMSIPINKVKDEVFSQRMLGDGIAFELTDNTIVSPVAGKVTAVFPTGHAIGLTTEDGLEVLIHIGLDTVELKGHGFTQKAEQGQSVEIGTPLINLDLEVLKKSGKDLTTMLVLTNLKQGQFNPKYYGRVTAGIDSIGQVMPVSITKEEEKTQ